VNVSHACGTSAVGSHGRGTGPAEQAEGASTMSRISRSLLAATAAHLGLAAALALAPQRPAGAPLLVAAPPEADGTELSLESDVTPAAPSAPAVATSPEAAAQVVASVASRGNTSVGYQAPGPSVEGAGEALAGAPAPPASSAGPLTLFRPNLAVGGPNPFLARGALEGAPTEREEANERAQQALRAGARERERELGLGPEGPVLTALGQAASGGTAPVTGKAIFLAIANGAGEVVSIDVVSCDGGRAEWAHAARDAVAALRGRKLRVPSAAKRAELKIEVTSAWKLPSGRDPGVELSLFGQTVKKGEGKQSTKVTVLDPIPKLTVVELAKDVRIPVPQVGLTVLGTNGDPADVGASPRRIVHTRLVDSKIL
jgi:hypothetical protein